jgi:biotin synthase
MIAILRIMMKDINIASTTALQALDKIGREKALMAGANIIMPNISPLMYRRNYFLYPNKPCVDENSNDCSECVNARVKFSGHEIKYGQWGDSVHFSNRQT